MNYKAIVRVTSAYGSQISQFALQLLLISILTRAIGLEQFSTYNQFVTIFSLLFMVFSGPSIVLILRKSLLNEGFYQQYLLSMIHKRFFALTMILIGLLFVSVVFSEYYTQIINLAIIMTFANVLTGNVVSLLNYSKLNLKANIYSIALKLAAIGLVFFYNILFVIDKETVLFFILFLSVLTLYYTSVQFNKNKYILNLSDNKKELKNVLTGQFTEVFIQRLDILLIPIFLSVEDSSLLIPVYTFFFSLTIPVTILAKYISNELIYVYNTVGENFLKTHGKKIVFFLLAYIFAVFVYFWLVVFFLEYFIEILYYEVDKEGFKNYLQLLVLSFIMFCISRPMFHLVLNMTKNTNLYRKCNLTLLLATLFIYGVIFFISGLGSVQFILAFTVQNVVCAGIFMYAIKKSI